MEPSTQPNSGVEDHISITQLENIKYLAYRFMTDCLARNIPGPRLEMAAVIEKDLHTLLEDIRAKAYVKGFRAGQRQAEKEARNGNPEN